jgi:hypothetical protein
MGEGGVDALPLGVFFRRVHPSIYVPVGTHVVPRVEPEVLVQALGSPQDEILFFQPDGRVVGVKREAFSPLQSALLEPERWTSEPAAAFEQALATETPTVWLEPLGMRPLRGAEPLDG